MRGLRPRFSTQQQATATQQILSAACSSKCIYCDIWRLATLVASHSPLSARYNLETGTPISTPTSSAPSSPVSPSSPTPYYSIIKACKRIEAQFQTQRSRLSSILSICTVSDAADATTGLRLAHDRCSQTIEDLLDQEEDLEEELLRDLQEQSYSHEYGYASQRTYQKSPTYDSHPCDRRSHMVH